MVFNSNYGTDAMLMSSATMVGAVVVGFIPVCGAMRRNHQVKE